MAPDRTSGGVVEIEQTPEMGAMAAGSLSPTDLSRMRANTMTYWRQISVVCQWFLLARGVALLSTLGVCAQCVEQDREAEMNQAIDRLRLIRNKRPKTVYILCSVLLDIHIDELVTWKQLTGDRRLSDALAKCDEKEWDALPPAPKQLSRPSHGGD